MVTRGRSPDEQPPPGPDVEDVAIVPDPHRPGGERARLADHGIAVWALIGHMGGEDGDVARAAEDFGIPEEAFRTALVYYRQHRSAIDARLATQRAATARHASAVLLGRGRDRAPDRFAGGARL